MIDLETIIGSQLSMAIKVNGIFLPFDALTRTLRNFAEPALFYCEDFGENGLSKSGSLFKARFNGRYFAIISAHQVYKSNYSFHEIVLSTDDQGNFATSSMASFPEGNSSRFGDFDCLAFDFTEPVCSGILPKSGWYDLSSDWNVGFPIKPDMVVSIGYPSHRNSIDYENLHYPAGPNAVWGKAVVQHLAGRLAFQPDPPLTHDPKGMSGSPVFGISAGDRELNLFFAGIVTEAGRSVFHFFPLFRIKKLLENIIET